MGMFKNWKDQSTIRQAESLQRAIIEQNIRAARELRKLNDLIGKYAEVDDAMRQRGIRQIPFNVKKFQLV
jgi:hypothetical protein